MDFSLSPSQRALQVQARGIAQRAVADFGCHHDSWMTGASREFASQLAELGWIGLTWPTEFGGGGRPLTDRLIVAEELITAGAPVAAGWFADRQIGPTIIAYGRPEQQRTYLPQILSGEAVWCIGMSEPNSGSDLASLTTSAIRHGDEYVINGQKTWTSHGSMADYCYLICRTSADGPPHRGISELIVRMDSPGVEVRPIVDMTGAGHFAEVFFDNVRVPAENLIGEEGGAFKQTMRQLEHERGGIDRLVSNHALYRLALDRADRADPTLRQEIAALETNYRIGRILVWREATRQAPRGFSAATKCFCTEHEQQVVQFAERVLGADAMIATPKTNGLLYGPAYTIMGGTSLIMRNIIGERVLGLPR